MGQLWKDINIVVTTMRQHNLPLPSYEPAELDRHVKVLDQWRDLHAVLEAFTIAQNSLASAEVVERIAWELFQDSAAQKIRLFEVRFSPDWAFSAHNLDWDAALEGILRSWERAESAFDMAIGLIAITSRSLGPDSCARTVDWAIRHRDHICAIDLADSLARRLPRPGSASRPALFRAIGETGASAVSIGSGRRVG